MGWRAEKVFGRPEVMIMPAWLYWPRRAWVMRHWWTLYPLWRLGLYEVREEGGYWKDGWFTWRFWRSYRRRYEAVTMGSLKGPNPLYPVWPLERLGWWVERQIERWGRVMPRWK